MHKYIKLDKKDIAYLHFILEGYEGMATATTIDKKAAVVKLFVPPEFISEVEQVLAALKEDLEFRELDPLERCL